MSSKNNGNPITRSELAYKVSKRVKRYLDSVVSSRCREIARPVLLKTKPQRSRTIDTSTSEWWKIGEGSTDPENMFLVNLDPTSDGSWQPEIRVMDPGSGSPVRSGSKCQSSTNGSTDVPLIRPTTTSEDGVRFGDGQLGSPPSATVSVPDPTITTSTALGGPRAEHTTYQSFLPQSAAAADDLAVYNIAVYGRESDVPPPTFFA
jgi:hypothetical protein